MRATVGQERHHLAMMLAVLLWVGGGDAAFADEARVPRLHTTFRNSRKGLLSPRYLYEDSCNIILEEYTFGEELCDCGQSATDPSIFESSCEDLCEVCLDDVGICLGFSSYYVQLEHEEGIGVNPTFVRLEYNQYVGIPGNNQSTFTFEETTSGCNVFIDGEQCESCEYRSGCSDGIGLFDCTNLEGIDNVFDDCDSSTEINIDSPFYAYKFLDLDACFANIEPSTPSQSPSRGPTPGFEIPSKKTRPNDSSKDDAAKLFESGFDTDRGGLKRKLRRGRRRR